MFSVSVLHVFRQVHEEILKITGESLGKVSLEAFTKMMSKADEVLNKAVDEERSDETTELKEKVDFLRQAEPLIQAIDPANAEDGYAPKVMDSLCMLAALAGERGVPFDDIAILALKRAVDSAVARADWSGACDLVLSDGSEGDVVNIIKQVKDEDRRQLTRKSLFTKLVMAAADEKVASDVMKSLMVKGVDIDKEYEEACSCVLTVMEATPQRVRGGCDQ